MSNNNRQIDRNLNPWKTMDEVFDDFFDRAFRSPAGYPVSFWEEGARRSRDTQLNCDIRESEQAYLLAMDMPGVKKEDLKIDLTGRNLSVTGTRHMEKSEDSQGVWRRERSYGTISRSFTLPDSVDVDKIEAELSDGVLRIALPKKEESKPRSIQVGEVGKGGFLSKLLGEKKANSGSVKVDTH